MLEGSVNCACCHEILTGEKIRDRDHSRPHWFRIFIGGTAHLQARWGSAVVCTRDEDELWAWVMGNDPSTPLFAHGQLPVDRSNREKFTHTCCARRLLQYLPGCVAGNSIADIAHSVPDSFIMWTALEGGDSPYTGYDVLCMVF